MSKRCLQLIATLVALTTVVVADDKCVEVTVYTAKGSEPISFDYATCKGCISGPCPDTARPGRGTIAATKTALGSVPISPGIQNTITYFPSNYSLEGATNEFCCDSRTQKCNKGKCKDN